MKNRMGGVDLEQSEYTGTWQDRGTVLGHVIDGKERGKSVPDGIESDYLSLGNMIHTLTSKKSSQYILTQKQSVHHSEREEASEKEGGNRRGHAGSWQHAN
jgi:hypothetical protein